jgi:precorrin-6B methylase 2
MTRYFEKTLDPSLVVFEFGSGGSTIFFAKRVGKIMSIEHESGWYKSVSASLGALNIKNIDYRLVSPEQGDGRALSSRPEYAGVNFDAYVNAINILPEESLDLVFVDGRCRTECALAARSKVRPGGRIVLDDGERENYSNACLSLLKEGWSMEAVKGLKPNQVAWGSSLIFTKPI